MEKNISQIKNLQVYGSVKGLTGKPSVDKPWLKYYGKEAKSASVPEETAYAYLLKNNLHNLDQIAIKYFNSKISYKELFEKIDTMAESFLATGVQKGEIVSICLPNFPEAVIGFYALNKIGAIANMIDVRLSEKELETYLNEVNSKKIMIFDQCLPRLESVIDKTNIDTVVSVSAFDSMPKIFQIANKKSITNDKCKFYKLNEFIKLKKPFEIVEPDPNCPCAIVHTGGTTGIPKGVVLTNRNFNAMVEQYRNIGVEMSEGQIFLNLVPPFIAYGLVNSMHMPLCFGMTEILIPKMNPKEFPQQIKKYKPNHVLGTPLHWDELAKSKIASKMDLSFLITAGVGGDVLPIPLEERIDQFLVAHNCEKKLSKGYGMTEAASCVATCTNNECNKPGSVGIPLPMNIISIFDPDTFEEKGYDEQGEICVLTPTAMLQYYNNTEETKQIFKIHDDGQEWLHTGDIGHMDENGQIFIDGRMKRIIVHSGGFKIFPALVESILASHKAVDSCCVVRLSHESLVNVAKAHIVLRKEYVGIEGQITQELKELCQEKLPSYSIPYEIEYNSDLPLTKSGKIDYKSLENSDNVKVKHI